MSGPPDKWYGFSTKGMTEPETFATMLSNAYSLGYTGPVVTVPSPQQDGSTWVAVGGYQK